MLYVIIIFLLIVVGFLLAVRSPRVGVNLIADWKHLHKMASTWISGLSGMLVCLVPVIDQLNDAIPQISSIESLHSITTSKPYLLSTGLLTLCSILARAWRQGALMRPPQGYKTPPDTKP